MPDPIPFPVAAPAPADSESATTRRHYCPAKDREGNSVKEVVSFAPNYIRQCQRVVAERQGEYLSVGDIVRVALHHWLNVLATENGRPGIMFAINLMREHRTDLDVAEGMEGELSDAGRRVDAYMAKGQRADAMRLLAYTRDVLDNLPPGPWQDKYRQDFQRRFAAYLQPTGPTAMTTESGGVA